VGVLGHPGDAVERRVAAQRDQGVVVVERLPGRELDLPVVGAEPGDAAPDERRVGPPDGVDGNRYPLARLGLGDDAVHLVEHQVVVELGDPGELGVVEGPL
jgi:hypothetical protein